jgi:cytochrome c-type biogenesis protein CcmF
MAALITGHLDDSWLRAVRRWTMFAWLFLSFGLTLGMIWAYDELGWGGYWGWDPVENAGLLPWFTATAFLHSVMVQERRSMLRVWNVTLVILTFFLTIFGTFMTRSGVVQSVHAFGEDPMLTRLFTGFMVTILTVSFGFVIYRMPLLRARNTLDSWVSREAAFLVNNWILLFSAFFVLFATMFPTLSEAVTGERITVGPPFFNKWMLPIGLLLLFLTGIGPLLAWRKSTLRNLRDSFLWPVLAALVTAGALAAAGVRVWISGMCFALCAFVAATVLQEFVRGAKVRRGATGTDLLTAMIGLVGRNKRRYGGYIVHLGIVLIFLGFAGEGFKLEEEVALKPGQQVTVGRFTLRNEALKVTNDDQKQMVTAHISVFEGGRQIDTLYPAKWFYRKHEDQPTTEVAIRRRPSEDLYVVLAKPDEATQTAFLHINVNPLVNWVWFGFGVMAVGTGIALLPERAFSFALARLPADAATTTATVLIALMLSMASLFAQDGGAAARGQQVSVAALKPLEKKLQSEIVCMCGGCKSPLNDCPMLYCHMREPEKAEIHALVEQGKTHEEAVAWFIKKYGGQEVLGAPVDKGFNRLAWLFPYLIGAGSAIGVAVVAVRLSRGGSADEPADPLDATDTKLDERLDDELRNLD